MHLFQENSVRGQADTRQHRKHETGPGSLAPVWGIERHANQGELVAYAPGREAVGVGRGLCVGA